MNLMIYLKEKKWYLISIVVAFCFSMALTALADDAFFVIVILICILFALCMLIPLALEYKAKKEFYDDLLMIFENLEKKNLIAELIRKPDFIEGAILYDILHRSNKACLDEIASYRKIQESYREYIELWVHEIKTPIASSKLVLQNAHDDPLSESLSDELDKIEINVQQVLFYSRSNNVDKDYLIKEISLASVCNVVIRKNAKILIKKKIAVETEGLDVMVLCDAKWLGFILEQMIGNAVKYSCAQNPEIRVSAHRNKNNAVLCIADNGIGIDPSEIGRIFDKGFTGTNGRTEERATGMGLYICRKLCDKLGLHLEVQSTLQGGSEFRIVFPRSTMIDLI